MFLTVLNHLNDIFLWLFTVRNLMYQIEQQYCLAISCNCISDRKTKIDVNTIVFSKNIHPLSQI